MRKRKAASSGLVCPWLTAHVLTSCENMLYSDLFCYWTVYRKCHFLNKL